MQLQSSAFEHGQSIPKRHAEDGQNLSPPLSWTEPPEKVVEYALIVEDPDAPRKSPWVHWVLYGIPASVTSIPEGIPNNETLNRPEGARQGQNSWGVGNIGYRGPAPPKGHGTHHYRFRLFALDRPLDLDAGVDNGALLKAMEHRVLESAELVGTYER